MISQDENVKQVFSRANTQQITQLWIFYLYYSAMYSRPKMKVYA